MLWQMESIFQKGETMYPCVKTHLSTQYIFIFISIQGSTQLAHSQVCSLKIRRSAYFVLFRNVVGRILKPQRCEKVGREADVHIPIAALQNIYLVRSSSFSSLLCSIIIIWQNATVFVLFVLAYSINIAVKSTKTYSIKNIKKHQDFRRQKGLLTC